MIFGSVARATAYSQAHRSPTIAAAGARKIHFIIIALIALGILFANLHKGDLSGYDDAAYAHEAKQLLATGDWWNIRLNGNLDFDKPPIFVWMEAISFSIFGPSDFAAKVPSALLGFGVIILVYLIAREIREEFWSPVVAMLIMVTTQYFMKYAMHAMTCVPFTFFFVAAIYFYLRGLKEPEYFIVCGIAAGLATLIRSPMGIIVVGILVTHLVVTRKYRVLRESHFITGSVLALLLPLVWYAIEYRLYGRDFLRAHFANILAHASSGRSKDLPAVVLSYFDYPVLLFRLYWPWLPLMLMGLVMLCRKAIRGQDSGSWLLVIWVVSVILPFSLADSKVLRYIMPAFPAFSILASVPITVYVTSQRIVRGLKVAYLLAIAAAVIIAVSPSYRLRAMDMRRLASVSDAFTAKDQRVVLYTHGEYQWDYRNQLLWYGSRFCEQVVDMAKVRSMLQNDWKTVVIMDKSSFDRSALAMKMKIEVLGESERFFCFRGARGA